MLCLVCIYKISNNYNQQKKVRRQTRNLCYNQLFSHIFSTDRVSSMTLARIQGPAWQLHQLQLPGCKLVSKSVRRKIKANRRNKGGLLALQLLRHKRLLQTKLSWEGHHRDPSQTAWCQKITLAEVARYHRWAVNKAYQQQTVETWRQWFSKSCSTDTNERSPTIASRKCNFSLRKPQ